MVFTTELFSMSQTTESTFKSRVDGVLSFLSVNVPWDSLVPVVDNDSSVHSVEYRGCIPFRGDAISPIKLIHAIHSMALSSDGRANEILYAEGSSVHCIPAVWIGLIDSCMVSILVDEADPSRHCQLNIIWHDDLAHRDMIRAGRVLVSVARNRLSDAFTSLLSGMASALCPASFSNSLVSRAAMCTQREKLLMVSSLRQASATLSKMIDSDK
jgi:hypothetical protein